MGEDCHLFTSYVMLALGLNIVIGFAGLLDLGYVAFYAVGAYLFALLSSSHLIENFTFFQYAFRMVLLFLVGHFCLLPPS